MRTLRRRRQQQHPLHIADKYKEKRDLIVSGLRDMGFEVNGADGAFYVFIKAPHGLTDIEFVEKATEHGVIIVPGRAFPRLHGFIRISYGASKETLERSIEALRKTISHLL